MSRDGDWMVIVRVSMSGVLVGRYVSVGASQGNQPETSTVCWCTICALRTLFFGMSVRSLVTCRCHILRVAYRSHMLCSS